MPVRARVQSRCGLRPRERRERVEHGEPGLVAGTISWEEHLEAFEEYAKLYGRSQTAERIHERGGFGYAELIEFLGHPPKTWEPIEGATS